MPGASHVSGRMRNVRADEPENRDTTAAPRTSQVLTHRSVGASNSFPPRTAVRTHREGCRK